MQQHNYYIYILTNTTKTVLYRGVTNNIEKHLIEHFTGAYGKSFTHKYNCYYLVHYERYQYIQHAIQREKEIKGWLRIKKVKLIEDNNPDWRFLNQDIMDWPPNVI
jgi:putative endonuclease